MRSRKIRICSSVFLIIILSFVIIFFTHKFMRGDTTTDSNIAHLTRQNMDSVQSSLKDSKYAAPEFNQQSLLSDVPSSKVYDPTTGKEEKVIVWDSWPVTNPDGSVANYHGYRLTIGLTAKSQRSDGSGTRMGLYAQKISDKSDDISSWQYLGNVFNEFGEGKNKNIKDQYLDNIVSEWSGSATLLKPNDTTLRLFYTNAILNPSQSQALTTAQISIEPKEAGNWNSGLVINHSKATDHKTVFVGDGKIYQRVDQVVKKGDYTDQFAMRDPRLIVDGNKYYLTFEGNTGTDVEPEGESNINNIRYFGSKKYYKTEKNRLLNSINSKQKIGNQGSNEYNVAYLSNAALGKLELNSDFTVKKVMHPFMTANTTNDQIERPNVFEYKGKWYIFSCFWGVNFASQDSRFNNQVFMFGYVSDNGINGKYKPLNGNGLVLASQTNKDQKNFTYAFLVIPHKATKDNEFVVTSFEANRTFAPSYLIQINGDKTKMINNRVLNQGALVDNGKYFKTMAQKF